MSLYIDYSENNGEAKSKHSINLALKSEKVRADVNVRIVHCAADQAELGALHGARAAVQPVGRRHLADGRRRVPRLRAQRARRLSWFAAATCPFLLVAAFESSLSLFRHSLNLHLYTLSRITPAFLRQHRTHGRELFVSWFQGKIVCPYY